MKCVLVLGFCGVMVGSAEAGQRWPSGPCADVATLRSSLEKGDLGSPSNKAMIRLGFLVLQRDRCGVDVGAVAAAADKAPLEGELDQTVARVGRRKERAGSRQPLNCYTYRLAATA